MGYKPFEREVCIEKISIDPKDQPNKKHPVAEVAFKLEANRAGRKALIYLTSYRRSPTFSPLD
jgi:hypothetical protein